MTNNKLKCDPEENALKSFFLGPQAENSEWVRELAYYIFSDWFEWRKSVDPDDGIAIAPEEQSSPQFEQKKEKIKEVLSELLERFRGEIPTFTPRYIGHMVSEMSIPALLGHIVTLLHNPNNINEEVSLVGSKIEREAILALAEMLGFSGDAPRGHFTSGGTVANFEALIRARARMARWMAANACAKASGEGGRNLFDGAHQGWESFDLQALQATEEDLQQYNILQSNPYEVANQYKALFGSDFKGPVVLAPGSKHYSWPKGILLLGLGREAFWPVELNKHGVLSVSDLKRKVDRARLENRPILLVVSVGGTTELGDFDPINEVSTYLKELVDQEGVYIWQHVDAAYGGFFCTLPKPPNSKLPPKLFDAMSGIKRANSVTIDPHKLGYVPYASGAFITRVTREYYVSPFDAPYLRFKQQEFKGTQTLEGSRSAAGAVATWLTAKTMGLDENGYGRIIERTIVQAEKLEQALQDAHTEIRVAPHRLTNIVSFCLAKEGEPVSEANARTEAFYQTFNTTEPYSFYVSKTALKWESYNDYLNDYTVKWNAEIDTDRLKLIRLTLMNPFFDSIQTKVNYVEEFCGVVKNWLDS